MTTTITIVDEYGVEHEKPAIEVPRGRGIVAEGVIGARSLLGKFAAASPKRQWLIVGGGIVALMLLTSD